MSHYDVCVVNDGESYLWSEIDGEWVDWNEVRNTDFAAFNELNPMDNFGIKVYAEPLDSTLVRIGAEAATCVDEGCIEHWYDTATGKYYKDSAGANAITRQATIVKALGHSWDKGTVTKAATAYTEGVRTYKCTRCGQTRTEPIAPTVTEGKTYTVSGSTYKVMSNTAKKRTVTLTKARNVKNYTLAASVKIKGAKYRVTGIGASAFAKAKATRTMTVKTKSLTASSVKNCLKGSKVTKVVVKVGSKAQNKTYVTKYKKLFAVKNPPSGKKVTVC